MPSKPKGIPIIQLREAGAQLHFLGYSYRYDRDRNGLPQRYLNLFPSDAAWRRQREKERQLLTARTAHVPAPLSSTGRGTWYQHLIIT